MTEIIRNINKQSVTGTTDQESDTNPDSRRLTSSIVSLSRAFYQTVLVDNPGAYDVVVDSLLKTLPVLDFVTDGDLAITRRGDREQDTDAGIARIQERVSLLPQEQIETTQKQLDRLIDVVQTISLPTASRLRPYLDVSLPNTRDGLRSLKKITEAILQEARPVEVGTQAGSSFSDLEAVLKALEDEVVLQITQDSGITDSILESARSEARVLLFEINRKGNTVIIEGLRKEVASNEMARLKAQKITEVVDGEEREFCQLDVELYRIIEEENLADKLPEAREQLEQSLSQKKTDVIETIVRRRVVRKVAGLMLSDPLLKSMAAKILGITEEEIEILKDDEGMIVRSRVANRLLDMRKSKLAKLGFTRFPDFDQVFEYERQNLTRVLELGDPLLFVASLDPQEYERVRNTIPNIFRRRLSAENRALFGLAKQELQERLAKAVTDDEIETILSDRLYKSFLEEFSRERLDRAIQSIGIDPQTILKNPLTLLDLADVILGATQSADAPRSDMITVGKEKEPKTKGYEFVVPSITTGKCQLTSPESLLRFGTLLATMEDLNKLSAAIRASEFVPYFDDPTFSLYPPERKMEMIFSIVGRGAGSKLAGSPIFELRTDFRGLETLLEETGGVIVSSENNYGNRVIKNTVRVSPLVGSIGQPFSSQLPEAARLIADAVDTVSYNLEEMLKETGADKISVEDATDIATKNLDSLMLPTTQFSPGREVLQMDFFLLYPAQVRRRMLQEFIETGNLDSLKDELSQLTRDGVMRASTFDISAGSGGVGITEYLSNRTFGKSSGHMEAYLDAVLDASSARLGRFPQSAAVMPRSADMTLMNFEYLPVELALRQRGLEAGISTLELLQFALESGNGTLTLPTLNGSIMRPDTILKRFTFPNEGKGAGYRGDILTLPDNVTMAPTNSSRIVASDKRVNLRIVEILAGRLRQLGIDPIPFIDLDLRAGNFDALSAQIIEFMEASREEYPEIDFLGAVIKTGDKIPGRERIAGEVISAYPIPSSVLKSEEMRRAFILKKLRELYLRGVSGVIIQPNILSLVADNSGNIAPKFEVKMMAFAQSK